MAKNKLKGLFSSDKDFWETPKALFNQLDNIFKFQLDAAASSQNAKCAKYFTYEDNALLQDWAKTASVIFINPPYDGAMDVWMEKILKEYKAGATIVCLIAARLESLWFKVAWDYAKYVAFSYGRIHFELNGIEVKRTTFASSIVVFTDKEWDLTSLSNTWKIIRLI